MGKPDNVIDLEARRPHVRLVDTDGVVRIIPLSVFERIRDGHLPASAIEGWEKVMPAIIGDWLDGLMEWVE